MSATHAVMTGGGVAFLISMALNAILPAPVPDPIIVHGLTYDAGYIIQDRTVKKPAWVAKWTADIVSDVNGRVVPNCHGDGYWTYPGGRLAPRISVTEWVGNEACALAPGRYYPRVKYSDGSFDTTIRGGVFTVGE